mmetsp:Transcript_54502/g.100837  ORF Transcript_54502/g.100837 Transcript_54502/m.100837 type:complete len:765 (-) Transcript_54502:194-2488(-)
MALPRSTRGSSARGLLLLAGALAVVLLRSSLTFIGVVTSPSHPGHSKSLPAPSKSMLRATAAAVMTKADETVTELLQGNRRFLSGEGVNFRKGLSPLNLLEENPYNQVERKALVLSCANLDVPIDAIFDVQAGELQSIRVMGFLTGDHDGVMSSVDFALASKGAPPLMIVMGDSDNEALKSALRVAMKAVGKEPPSSDLGDEEGELELVKRLLPACEDALRQAPNAKFEKLLELAVKYNVWFTIQTLLSSSPTVFELVQAGELMVTGAYIDTSTGSVKMLGEHPTQEKLLMKPPLDDRVRTAQSPGVPPEEAYAQLVAGNNRFANGKGETDSNVDVFLNLQLLSDGQQPMSSIMACSDSRVPVELTFDKRPGDIFVMRTAGNIIGLKPGGSLLGSAEFSIAALKAKLLVVLGHTKCGAVTEAVKATRAKMKPSEAPGSIGTLLVELDEAAQEAVAQLPKGEQAEQIALATRINIFTCIRRFIENSDIIKAAVKNMDIAIHGAYYDLNTGKVEWLGQHPDLEDIVGAPMPVHKWKQIPYSSEVRKMKPAAQATIEKLKAGNANFVAGKGGRFTGLKRTEKPEAIVVTCTEIKVKPQLFLDAAPGEIITQRTLANTVGNPGGTLFASLEYAVKRFAPPVLLIVGDSDDPVVKQAIDHVQGFEAAPFAMQPVLDKVSAAAVRALDEFSSASSTSAGESMKVMRVAVELNVLYGIEQLLINSDIIREAVSNGMEIQAAVLDHLTGEVEFLGPHPKTEELVQLGKDRAL